MMNKKGFFSKQKQFFIQHNIMCENVIFVKFYNSISFNINYIKDDQQVILIMCKKNVCCHFSKAHLMRNITLFCGELFVTSFAILGEMIA